MCLDRTLSSDLSSLQLDSVSPGSIELASLYLDDSDDVQYCTFLNCMLKNYGSKSCAYLVPLST